MCPLIKPQLAVLDPLGQGPFKLSWLLSVYTSELTLFKQSTVLLFPDSQDSQQPFQQTMESPLFSLPQIIAKTTLITRYGDWLQKICKLGVSYQTAS